MTVRFARVYFVRGDHTRHNLNEVRDPPTSGHGHVVILPGEKRSTMLSPFTLQSYQVSNGCAEMRSAIYVDISPEKLARHITKAWQECVELGFQRDFGVAALVLTELGQPVPKFVPPPQELGKRGTEAEEPKRGGKPVVKEALRPCKRSSKRGEVAAFFMLDGPQSLHEAMARLGMTRSGVLSHLFTLNRDHGVGYSLSGDCASLIVPEGFDLFAVPEPEVRPETEDGEATDAPAPRKRTGSKPIVPEALKPIPEPGKRATVARLFVEGWYNVASAMETLGLDRSAVLSHLFTINKENGLGYELSDDGSQARLLVPEGHEPFGAKVPRTKKEA